ncbi:putative c-type cyclin protein [Zalerion maritima]|uniref:RNA polymerase II holoenzyme cyclin-like subunit n=1 Tax=Zalerion maritima TaxID=339359 RepID=A0AAD5RHU6_9PEZI|nr:putative c-type cyclin protein [Zalerion maritima]
MAPRAGNTSASADASPADPVVPRGPNPGAVTLSAPFISQVKIDRMKKDLSLDHVKEETSRLQGVELIHKVRTAILLPVKTFDTACCYYHKFRLCYRDADYSFSDVALASLFVSCKTEDTPKKSREILCAAYNIKSSSSDQKTPDDKSFDQPSKLIIGLERMILELVSFDMSGRYPQYALPKVVRGFLLQNKNRHGDGRNGASEEQEKEAKEVYDVAYDMSIDMYKTYAPLKQTTYTMALALFELSCRLVSRHEDSLRSIRPSKWHTTRASVVETMLDLLDLYIDNEKSTLLASNSGSRSQQQSDTLPIPATRFLQVKIELNEEVEISPGMDRYTRSCSKCAKTSLPKGTSSVLSNATPNVFGVPIVFNIGAIFSPSGSGPAQETNFLPTPRSGSGGMATSPASVNGSAPASASASSRRPGSVSGTNGTTANNTTSVASTTLPTATGPNRFVFDREEGRREGERVNQFFEDRFENYEVEVEETIPEPPPNPPTAPAEARRGQPPPRGPSFSGGGDTWGRRRGGGGGGSGGGGPYDGSLGQFQGGKRKGDEDEDGDDRRKKKRAVPDYGGSERSEEIEMTSGEEENSDGPEEEEQEYEGMIPPVSRAGESEESASLNIEYEYAPTPGISRSTDSAEAPIMGCSPPPYPATESSTNNEEEEEEEPAPGLPPFPAGSMSGSGYRSRTENELEQLPTSSPYLPAVLHAGSDDYEPQLVLPSTPTRGLSSGETTIEEGGETTVEEGGETTVEEGGETTVEEGGETTVEEGGETTVEEGGDANDGAGGEGDGAANLAFGSEGSEKAAGIDEDTDKVSEQISSLKDSNILPSIEGNEEAIYLAPPLRDSRSSSGYESGSERSGTSSGGMERDSDSGSDGDGDGDGNRAGDNGTGAGVERYTEEGEINNNARAQAQETPSLDSSPGFDSSSHDDWP